MNIAHNIPRRLLLSRTRTHGISLGPLGLDDMMLDPRLGLHLAVLAAAAQRGEDRPVMTLTQNAAAHVAAYGAPVRRWGGISCATRCTATSPTTSPHCGGCTRRTASLRSCRSGGARPGGAGGRLTGEAEVVLAELLRVAGAAQH